MTCPESTARTLRNAVAMSATHPVSAQEARTLTRCGQQLKKDDATPKDALESPDELL